MLVNSIEVGWDRAAIHSQSLQNKIEYKACNISMHQMMRQTCWKGEFTMMGKHDKGILYFCANATIHSLRVVHCAFQSLTELCRGADKRVSPNAKSASPLSIGIIGLKSYNSLGFIELITKSLWDFRGILLNCLTSKLHERFSFHQGVNSIKKYNPSFYKFTPI